MRALAFHAMPTVVKRVGGCLAALVLASSSAGAAVRLPAGLPVPSGLHRVYAKAGTSSAAYRFSLRYSTNRPARALAAYLAAVRRAGFETTVGPGENFTFPFRRWVVFVCAESGCSAPKNRLDVIVATPGG